MNTVTVYKMVSGEEVIAKCVEFDGTVHTVSDARVLRMMQTPQGPMPALMPWIISLADEELTFTDDKVIVWKDAPSDIERAYLQETSGLQIAQSLMG